MNANNNVILIDPSTDPRWDRFVEDHPFGWICHLSGWKDVLEKSFKHMKGYYFALMDDSGENIRAGLPVYLIKSILTGKRLVSIPFATICDPLISSDDDLGLLLEKAKYFFEKNCCSHFELRAYLATQLIKNWQSTKSENHKNHILSLENSLDEIKKSFHPMVKRNIEKSNHYGLVVRVTQSKSDLIMFYSLYFRTRKNLELPCQPYNFFENIHKFLFSKKLGCLILVEKDGMMIGGSIFFTFKNRFAYEYAGWDRNYNEFRPNYFILWEAIKLAHSNRYKLFDFGRTSTLNNGLMEFKGRWGTKIMDLQQFYYSLGELNAFVQEENSIKYKAIKTLCRILPDSLYNQLGKFIYRHIG